MGMLCMCNHVSEEKLERFLKKHPNASILDIQRHTGAATGCGRCGKLVKAHIDKIREDLPNSPQLRLFK